MARADMPVDMLHRCAYRLGHRLARLWWWASRPSRRGVAVAVWWQGRLLVVRPSYRAGFDLPGGGLAAGEEPRQGAVRELAEELALEIRPQLLQDLGVFAFTLDHRRISETLFAWHPPSLPAWRVDRREIVWAGLVEPAALEDVPVSPSVRHALLRSADH
jgi:ADP-ribose pyrophosphatase YjhB (NUDIX family)